jgi:hypothetical protein
MEQGNSVISPWMWGNICGLKKGFVQPPITLAFENAFACI